MSTDEKIVNSVPERRTAMIRSIEKWLFFGKVVADWAEVGVEFAWQKNYWLSYFIAKLFTGCQRRRTVRDVVVNRAAFLSKLP